MNSLKIKTVVGGALIGALQLAEAAPSLTIGENSYLFFNGSAGIEHQTNVRRSSVDEVSDTAFVVTPGVELKFGGTGAANGRLTAAYELRQYTDDSELNGEYARLRFDSIYDTEVLVATAYAGFNQYPTVGEDASIITDVVGTVAVRDDLALGGAVKYRFTDTMGASVGLDFFRRTWDSESNLTGTQSWSVPAKVLVEIAPKLDAVAGFRYREVEAHDVPDYLAVIDAVPSDYSDSYFFAGIEGEVFNELWSINLDVGYQTRDYEDSAVGSSDKLSYKMKLNYRADETRTYYVLLARDFGESSTNGQSYTRSRLTVGGQARVTEVISVMAGITYATTDYAEVFRVPGDESTLIGRGGKDDLLYGTAGVIYSPNEYLSVSATLSYLKNDSNLSYFEYSNNIYSLSASLRY